MQNLLPLSSHVSEDKPDQNHYDVDMYYFVTSLQVIKSYDDFTFEWKNDNH